LKEKFLNAVKENHEKARRKMAVKMNENGELNDADLAAVSGCCVNSAKSNNESWLSEEVLRVTFSG